MAPPNLCGVWQIYKCDSLKGDCACRKIYGIEGTTFQLDGAGDVVWKPAEGCKGNPILNCDTYEVYHPSHSCTIIQFGAHIGHVIEFKVEELDPSGHMTLKNELWCCLYCKRISTTETDSRIDAPYSLLSALENGFFSDTIITASSGKQFLIHSSILTLIMPDVDWSQSPPPFSGLPEDVLGAILHYLYAECLPSNLTENCARQVISSISQVPSSSLLKLTELCEVYIRHNTLKKEIIDLTEDMHVCANQIIEYFMGSRSAVLQGSDNLKGNPAKLCYVLKQCIRECAVGIGKFVVLCHTITKRNEELSAQEGREIIRYAKSRLPTFLKQLNQLLKAIKSTSNGMTSSQRNDIACYVVPEIEKLLETVSTLAMDVKGAMEVIINESSSNLAGGREEYAHCPKCRPAGCTGTTIDGLEVSPATNRIVHLLAAKETSKLRKFHQYVAQSLSWLMQKRESFNEMSDASKIRSVSRNIEQMLEELPIFLLRLQDVDDKLEWREFKFVFKIAASKVAGWVDVIIKHKGILQDVCEQVSNLVHREEFTKSVVTLGLINPSQQACSSPFAKKYQSSCSAQASFSPFDKPEEKLNLLQSVCSPPPPHQSLLSKQALPLLKSGIGCDMVFEVIAAKDVETNGEQQSETETDEGTEQEEEVLTIKAHRVIVAARCDWFRRALLSGMRETIDRKIQIYDTNPALFSTFLEYLYCGCVNSKDLNVDQWAELLMLADRYEVDTLKQVCEQALKGHLDNDSVLYFLSVADQFNAKALKDACLTYASHHGEIMDHALFAELPQNLQAEIYDVLIWVKQPFNASRDPSSSTLHSSDLEDLQSLMSSLQAGAHQSTHSISDSLEELPLTQDASRLERCIQDLFDIVGEDASRHELAQIAMAADYDVNRALNFYYEQKKEA